MVCNKAVEAGAEAWLPGLDGLVAGLAEEWELTLEGTYEEGTEAFVAAGRCADGAQAAGPTIGSCIRP